MPLCFSIFPKKQHQNKVAFLGNHATIQVMKYNYIQQIAQRILEDISCPRCKHSFQKEKMEIDEIGESQVDFFIPCAHCDAKVSICADIEVMNSAFLPRQHNAVKKGNNAQKLSPQNIQQITQSIQKFRGKDVRKLF